MKRDWKLIRAIVREEDTSAWPNPVVLEHHALCGEAGYCVVAISRGQNGQIQTHRPTSNFVTPRGSDVADILANSEDLDAVLAQMDASGVGHVSDIVLEMMQRKARARLANT
jgi:hypothetical protein